MERKLKCLIATVVSLLCFYSGFLMEFYLQAKMEWKEDATFGSTSSRSNQVPVVYQNSLTKTEFPFKVRGIVYDCLSRRTMKKYDASFIEKNSRPIQMPHTEGEDPYHRKDLFVEIFNNQVWGGKESGVLDKTREDYKASGPGSELKVTIGCMALLHSVIEKLKIHLNKDVISIADVPCGDLQWMSHFLKTRTDIKYTGIDIVPDLIHRHTKTYQNNPNINFLNIDVVHSPLNHSFDVIFSRQMMQHLKNVDVQRALTHFSQSGTRYLIATTSSDLGVNRDLMSNMATRYRGINLEKPPYSLTPPICSYQEPVQTDIYLPLWELPLYTIKTETIRHFYRQHTAREN